MLNKAFYSKFLFPFNDKPKQNNRCRCDNDGSNALQYSTTEGYDKLREYIASRYLQQGVDVTKDQIMITSGSQQALDLIGKIFIDKDDKVVIVKPGYLGAIQAFSLYQPKFIAIDLQDDGLDIEKLKRTILENKVKLKNK